MGHLYHGYVSHNQMVTQELAGENSHFSMDESSKDWMHSGLTFLQLLEKCLISEEWMLISETHKFYQVAWETMGRGPACCFVWQVGPCSDTIVGRMNMHEHR